MSVRRIDAAQRRARLALRHHLARPAARCLDVALDLIGLHSSDAASVMLAARARTRGLVPADVEALLYDERLLARVLGMRRTMFVVPTELVEVIHAACARPLAARERARLVRMLEDAGVASDGARWLAAVERDTLAALGARGQATARELAAEVPALRIQLSYGAGKPWGGTFGVSTRVLFLLATSGQVVRARPEGSWTSTRYRWAPLRTYLGADIDALDTEPARVALARRWLAAFGPGTFEDLKWWTGWTVADTRRALAGVGPVEVDLGGATGLVLAGDDAPVDPPEPRAALLPALDPTVMGWKQRDWYLGADPFALFDRNGNAGPTVWWDGQVVGGWAQRAGGEIAVRLLADVGAAAAAAVEAEAARLADWLGSVRFTPRFRTPLERELAA